jgi:hypothetical protein
MSSQILVIGSKSRLDEIWLHGVLQPGLRYRGEPHHAKTCREATRVWEENRCDIKLIFLDAAESDALDTYIDLKVLHADLKFVVDVNGLKAAEVFAWTARPGVVQVHKAGICAETYRRLAECYIWK